MFCATTSPVVDSDEERRHALVMAVGTKNHDQHHRQQPPMTPPLPAVKWQKEDDHEDDDDDDQGEDDDQKGDDDYRHDERKVHAHDIVPRSARMSTNGKNGNILDRWCDSVWSMVLNDCDEDDEFLGRLLREKQKQQLQLQLQRRQKSSSVASDPSSATHLLDPRSCCSPKDVDDGDDDDDERSTCQNHRAVRAEHPKERRVNFAIQDNVIIPAPRHHHSSSSSFLFQTSPPTPPASSTASRISPRTLPLPWATSGGGGGGGDEGSGEDEYDTVDEIVDDDDDEGNETRYCLGRYRKRGSHSKNKQRRKLKKQLKKEQKKLMKKLRRKYQAQLARLAEKGASEDEEDEDDDDAEYDEEIRQNRPEYIKDHKIEQSNGDLDPMKTKNGVAQGDDNDDDDGDVRDTVEYNSNDDDEYDNRSLSTATERKRLWQTLDQASFTKRLFADLSSSVPPETASARTNLQGFTVQVEDGSGGINSNPQWLQHPCPSSFDDDEYYLPSSASQNYVYPQTVSQQDYYYQQQHRHSFSSSNNDMAEYFVDDAASSFSSFKSDRDGAFKAILQHQQNRDRRVLERQRQRQLVRGITIREHPEEFKEGTTSPETETNFDEVDPNGSAVEWKGEPESRQPYGVSRRSTSSHKLLPSLISSARRSSNGLERSGQDARSHEDTDDASHCRMMTIIGKAEPPKPPRNDLRPRRRRAALARIKAIRTRMENAASRNHHGKSSKMTSS